MNHLPRARTSQAGALNDGLEIMNEQEKQKDTFETTASSLLGRRIEQVTYYDYPLEGGTFDPFMAFVHSMRVGLELSCDDGFRLSITWGPWTHDPEVGLRLQSPSLQREMSDDQPMYVELDVSSDSQWAPLLDSPIVQVDVYWQWVEEEHALTEPLDLVIGFAHGTRLFVSAGHCDGERFMVSTGDNLVIVFDEGTAEKFRLGPYAPHDFKRRRSSLSSDTEVPMTGGKEW